MILTAYIQSNDEKIVPIEYEIGMIIFRFYAWVRLLR